MSIVKEIAEVLDAVHARFTYVRDIERWKTADYWISKRDGDFKARWKGDCEDYALLCRDELNALGIPNRLVFCRVLDDTSGAPYHIVSEVAGIILDVRFRTLQTRNTLRYEFISMSGYKAGEPWHEILPPDAR